MEKIIPKNLSKGIELPLMEAFQTIQGEGFHTGKAAYFLRIGGCDVGCHWCDIKESWDISKHPLTSIDKIINEMSHYSINTVVITGGEPLMYNLQPLTLKLKERGMKVHLETSGSYPLTGSFDWVCLSPKKQQPVLDEIKSIANELKVIIHNINDMRWAESQIQSVQDICRLYLQPEWSKRDIMIPKIINYITKNPHWTISLQTHKYMNIP